MNRSRYLGYALAAMALASVSLSTKDAGATTWRRMNGLSCQAEANPAHANSSYYFAALPVPTYEYGAIQAISTIDASNAGNHYLNAFCAIPEDSSFTKGSIAHISVYGYRTGSYSGDSVALCQQYSTIYGADCQPAVTGLAAGNWSYTFTNTASGGGAYWVDSTAHTPYIWVKLSDSSSVNEYSVY
jgi:hypothetical protein